jgi:hypothetical protein
VVISSNWRETHTLDELRNFFSIELRERVIGCTPVLPDCTRLDEILCVVREYGVTQWAALDDRVQNFQIHAGWWPPVSGRTYRGVAASAHPRDVGRTVKVWNALLCLFGIHSPLSTPIYSSWDGTQVHERRCARCGKVLGHILN